MTQIIRKALDQHQDDKEKLFQEFLSFLRMPSVSNSNEHKEDMLKTADFLVKKLSDIGFQHAESFPTGRHPIVYAEYVVDPEKPTILLYGHYDVQPTDPLDEWRSAPFEPHLEGDYLYARGASDMKGQIWATISALQSVLQSSDLAINVKYLIEGEEEIGSPSLAGFMEEHKSMLACDFVLNPDAGMIAPDKPTIVYALRGLAYFELKITGPKSDLHSGSFGGVVANPANVLSRLIAAMHDNKGKVMLPGFYDDVREITENESLELSRLGIDENFYKKISGVPNLGGEEDFDPIERVGARPTLDVNGLYSGFIEKGAKTIIPAFALAKISCRLVPDQDPQKVLIGFRKFLEEQVPSSVIWELKLMSGAPAYIAGEETPGLEAFKKALKATWNVDPVLKREGGSIPVATEMKEILGVDSIITGFGLPDDQIHSPNERLHLPTQQKGVEALIRFFLGF